MRSRIRVIVAAVLAAVAPASAQVASPPAASGGGTLAPFLRFDRVTGMAKGAITAIAQDSSGFLWFGTEEGLSRYDGYDFVNYVPGGDSTNTLSSFSVTALAAGKDALWIGTEKGLDRLELATGTFSHFHASKDGASLASDTITSLALGDAGVLWIGTDAGVDSLDPGTGAFHHYRAQPGKPDTLSDDAISVVLAGKNHVVWVGTQQAGLNRLDPATGKVTRFAHDAAKPKSLSNDQITSLFEDSHGTLWVGTMDGLDALDIATGASREYLSDPEAPVWITTIVEGADGGLWLGVKGVGVFRLDRSSGAIERYSHDGSDPSTITHPWARCSFSDAGGVLWFGFHAGGASKLYLPRRDFAYYRTNPGLAFLEDGDRVWLGTQGLGLRELDLRTGAVRTYLADELSGTWTMKIIAGAEGALWLGTTDQGLLQFTPSTGQAVHYDTASGRLASDAVFALLRDGNTLWIGTFGGGLARLDTRTNAISYFRSDPANPSTLGSDFVSALYQDPANDNLIWIGTTGGLDAFDKRTGKVMRYQHDAAKPTSLTNDRVNDIHRDSKGRLWVATWGGGLDLVDTAAGTFSALHTRDGLPSEVVYGIMEDKRGHLWITTNDGLADLDPATHQITTYRSGDGLQDDEFGQGGFFQGASGRMYVGGPRGFNVFVPDKIKPDTYVPPIAITDFAVLGQSRPVPQRVALSYRDRWFSVTFASLAYAMPSRNRYKYRVVGLHDWIETERRFVTYSSLPPGDYTLEIVGANAHGVWATTDVKLPIHVPPPPWRTWWAFSLYALLALLIAGLLYRRYRAQLDALSRTHRLSELEREVALSSAVQEGFFPLQRSVHDGVLRLEAFYRAAAQCGGDWWSYEARGDRYFVVVGDATGHGIGSAMVTAAAASTFRALGPGIDDESRLAVTNQEVLRVSRGQYHMTLTAVEVELATGRYLIRSAGGVPVFSLAPGARPRVLMCPGTPLGSENFQTGTLEGQLVAGERLMILTDGMVEVALANGNILGPRGIADVFSQTRGDELATALQQLVAKVEEVSSTAQDDDWTVVIVQWGNDLTIRSTPR